MWQKVAKFKGAEYFRQALYINELARALEKSAAPGLTRLESEVKCLLFADDLVLLSLTEEGLQQHLDLLDRFCQTWALTVNLSKTKIMVFQKRFSRQDHKYKFHLDTVALERTKNYTYLGLNIRYCMSYSLRYPHWGGF